MNDLRDESSLYLRQHADNPVDWQPWCETALETARESDRPILLSIGYSACHWCHVMAHESFEDEATARIMNRLFVNIKVDREERPDLDRIYQLSHQLLTGRGGGWPLTVFLDPADLVPFFAGTYFPPERRYGMPAFRELLQAIHRWYGENRQELGEQSARLRSALESIQAAPRDMPHGADEPFTQEVCEQAVQQIRSRFDPVHGGFGGAPRFPQAPLLEAVAALGREPAFKDLEERLEFSLERMALSGLRDHLDGGFFRYCVDGAWTIPHFEKMLYDNAMLLPLYAEGARRWNNTLLAATAEGIAGWLQDEMRQPSGGYAASIDADADGEEGGFHVWQAEQIDAGLDDSVSPLFRRAYGLDDGPNFEGRAWHLQRRKSAADLGDEFGLTEAEVEQQLAAARERLREIREERVHPTRDNKQLTSWNALLAGGLVRAARALGREDWLDRAAEILDFIRRELWQDGRLLAVFNAGEARFAAYLDDYAWLLSALLDYLSVRWEPVRLAFAMELAETLLERFEDLDAGGFFFSDASIQVPITRSMIFQDDATPAGNAGAILALNRLGRLVGEPRFTAAADRCLQRAGARLKESPLAHAGLLPALQDAVRPPPHLVIGGSDADATASLKQWVEANYRVDCFLIGPPDRSLPGILAGYGTAQPVSAWLCHGMRCLPPVQTRAELEPLLE
jgi:uncharacterized protein YyaL (SSP411 family)